jgi:uncharacterized protein RhaS with RHS repeats
LGRFLSEDPLGLQSGDSNLYRYVFNQPLTAVDPAGLASLSELGAQVRAALTSRQALCMALGAAAGTLVTVAIEGLGAPVAAAGAAGSAAALGADAACLKVRAIGAARPKPKPPAPDEPRPDLAWDRYKRGEIPWEEWNKELARKLKWVAERAEPPKAADTWDPSL